MALEKAWSAVPPVLLTADGGAHGIIQVTDTEGFFTKQQATLQDTSGQTLTVEIKRVVDKYTLWVGPKGPINARSNCSAFTVANGSFIFAAEQDKSLVPNESRFLSTYETDPVDAWRVVPVDPYGDVYGPSNPLPVAIDGTIAIGDVSIVEGGNTLTVNNDGSINVNVVETPVSGHNVRNIYNEVFSVASGVETLIVSYTVPIGKTAILERITTSGNNVARYNVYLNAAAFDAQRTYFGGEFNAAFEFTTGTGDGVLLTAGQVLAVKVLQNRPFVGDFNARIQVLEIS